jgi:hypothetical protein
MSVIVRSGSQSSRKMPECPSWMTVHRDFYQSELVVFRVSSCFERGHKFNLTLSLVFRDLNKLEERLWKCINLLCPSLQITMSWIEHDITFNPSQPEFNRKWCNGCHGVTKGCALVMLLYQCPPVMTGTHLPMCPHLQDGWIITQHGLLI